MSKLRVYMVAKELGMDNKAFVALLQSLGASDVKNHMSAVTPEQIERAKRQLNKGDDRNDARAPASAGSVIIRRGKRPDGSPEVAVSRPPTPASGSAHAAHPASGASQSSTSQSSAARPPAPAQSGAGRDAQERAPVKHAPAPVEAVAPRSEPQVAAEAAPTREAEARPASPEASAELPRPVPAAEQAAAPVVPTLPPAQPVAAAPAPVATAEAKVAAPSAEKPAAAVVESPVVAAPAVAPVAPPVAESRPAVAAPAAVEVAPVDSKPSVAAAPVERAKSKDAGQAVMANVREVDAPAPSAKVERASAPHTDDSSHATSPVRGRETRPAATTAPRPVAPVTPPRPSSPPKTGIDVWQGRPGVPMPQPPRGGTVPRRVQYDAKGGPGGPGGPPRPGGPGGPGGHSLPGQRGGNNRGRGPMGGMAQRRGGPMSQGFGSRRPGLPSSVTTQERSAHKKVVKMEQDISLQTLAARMGVKAGEVLMKLMSLGVTGININSSLDSDTAKIVAEEFGWTVEDVAVSEDAAIAAAQGPVEVEEEGEREPRPPVVTVMGHVDHGKTSLLDKIRRATVAAGEAGGITQHIGAYSVKTPKGRVTFMDTPGHAAFTQMRARGAKATDIIVLVVAADDGVMPQTKEAINHAREGKCPIVVAINKMDKPDAQPERVRRELADCGLMPEEWGGDTLFVEVSAQTGAGIDTLLDSILLQAEVLDLKANPKRHARGTVIEAKLDRGRGPVATVLVTDGTLRKGDGLLVGNSWGKVRAMLDDAGRSIAEAGPSTPVSVIGLSEVPSAGDMVDAVQDAKKAQQIAEQRRDRMAERSRGSTTKVSLEELARRMNQSDQKELKLIIKGDVQGTVEALNEALEKMSTDKVRVNVVHTGVGAITEGDVNLAVAARAVVIGFNTRPAGKAATLAQKEGIEIRQYSIIYDVTDDVKASMEGLLAPTLVEEPIGEAEVRKIFKVTKAGVVAGCMVIQGVVRRNSMVRLRREKEIIWEGRLDSLKRFKDDAKEVREGFDCGISFQGFSNLQEGDIIAAFEMKEVRPTL